MATSLNNLAELYRAQGRYAEAEPLFKRLLMISEMGSRSHSQFAVQAAGYFVAGDCSSA